MRRVLILLALSVSAFLAGFVAFVFTTGTRIEPARPRAPVGRSTEPTAPPKIVRGTLRPGPKGGVYFDECGASVPAWIIDDTLGDLTTRWSRLAQGGLSGRVWIEALAVTDTLPSARLAPGCDRCVRVSRVDRLVPEGKGARCGS